MLNVNYDDLLATVHKHVKDSKCNYQCTDLIRLMIYEDFAYDWLIELSRILKVHVDYSEEAHYDVLIRNTTIQLCLSIQQSLGFRGEFHPRTFAGKLSWIVLQLRNIVVVVTMAANMKVKGPNNENATPLEDPGLFPLLFVQHLN